MRAIVGVILLSLLQGCGSKGDNPIDPARSEAEPTQDTDDEEQDEASADAGTHATPIRLSIELPLLVARDVEVGADGSYVWGEPQPIDGALVCAIERRDEFAIYEPYEPLEPPICFQSRAGEAPWLSGLPAHSDLTITVVKDGYIPIATTQRLEAADLPRVSYYTGTQLVLFTEEQAALFQTPDAIDPPDASDTDAAERGLLAIEYAMFDLSFQAAGDRGRLLSDPTSPFLLARDGQLALSVEPGGDALEWDLPDTQLLLEVPAGLYRAKVNHPRAYCEPQGTDGTYTFWGLSTAEPSELEVRVLPGRVTALEALCYCVPPNYGDVPVDGRACVFSDAELPDAGASMPDAAALPDAGVAPL